MSKYNTNYNGSSSLIEITEQVYHPKGDNMVCHFEENRLGPLDHLHAWHKIKSVTLLGVITVFSLKLFHWLNKNVMEGIRLTCRMCEIHL